METVLNKCPICGGKLFEDNLYQYSKQYPIGRYGQILKSQCKKIDIGSMDTCSIFCENQDFITNADLEIIEPYNFRGSIFRRGECYMLERESEG